MSVKQLKTKDINLLDSYLKGSKQQITFGPMIKYAIPPLLLVVLFGGFYGILQFQNHQIQSEIDRLKKETTSLQEQLDKDPNVALYQELQTTKRDALYYQNLYEMIDTYPVLKQGVFNTIAIQSYGIVEVSDLSYARESQVVTLQIESSLATGAEQYVRALKASDVFADVSYTGYVSTEKSTSTSTTKEEDKISSDAEKILEYLKQQAENSSKESAATTTVYSATILCTLK